ncbi:MAG: DinB family protein [Terriglobales bacterium]
MKTAIVVLTALLFPQCSRGQENTFHLTVLGYQWATTHRTLTFSWPGYSNTSCNGSLNVNGTMSGGNIYATGTSSDACSTTYTPPTTQNIEIQKPVVFILADTDTNRMIITCTRNLRWSQCHALDPGSFLARIDHGHFEVQAAFEKGKEEWIKFDIVQQSAISRPQSSPVQPAAAIAQPAPAAAAPAPASVKNPVSSALRDILPNRQKNTIAAVEAMPADKFGFKPSPDQMTFGHLVAHMIEANYGLCSGAAAVSAPKVEEAKDTDSKDKLVAALKASFDFCADALGKMDDSKLAETTTGGPGGQQLSRARFALGIASNWADHYAEAAMYLRQNGILPPTAKK